jgi:hypothetical protein
MYLKIISEATQNWITYNILKFWCTNLTGTPELFVLCVLTFSLHETKGKNYYKNLSKI